MSNISSTNNITITRGDTFSYKYYINLGTPMDPENYILTENDRLYLGVYSPGQSFENALIRKMYTKDDMTDDYVLIKFKTKDTQYVIPDTYYYDIKLRRNIGTEDEEIITLVHSRIFWVEGTLPQANVENNKIEGLILDYIQDDIKKVKEDIYELNVVDEQHNDEIDLLHDTNEQQNETFNTVIKDLNDIFEDILEEK